jgi:hypothetical protein
MFQLSLPSYHHATLAGFRGARFAPSELVTRIPARIAKIFAASGNDRKGRRSRLFRARLNVKISLIALFSALIRVCTA